MIYAFICTRSKELTDTAHNLSTYLSDAGVKVKFLVNQKSIFGGYQKALDSSDVKDDDIVILCHDDIEIMSSKWVFRDCLMQCLAHDAGFIGVAGTAKLLEDAVWWNGQAWREGHHSGIVWHGPHALESTPTYYGPYKTVVVMDGLFLAASGKTLRKVGLAKPRYLEGEWDYYDIHYTLTAHKLGLKNRTVPINVLHNSRGELAGRESWHVNRAKFIEEHRLPITAS